MKKMLSKASVKEVKLIVKKSNTRSSRPTEELGNRLKKSSKDSFTRCDYLRYMTVPGLYEDLRGLRRKVSALFGDMQDSGTMILNRCRFACPICENVFSLDDEGSLTCFIKHLKNKHDGSVLGSTILARWETMKNGDTLSESGNLQDATFPGVGHPECCDLKVLDELRDLNNELIKKVLFEKVPAKVTSDYFINVKEYLK
jgi:hypothetical protein